MISWLSFSHCKFLILAGGISVLVVPWWTSEALVNFFLVPTRQKTVNILLSQWSLTIFSLDKSVFCRSDWKLSWSWPIYSEAFPSVDASVRNQNTRDSKNEFPLLTISLGVKNFSFRIRKFSIPELMIFIRFLYTNFLASLIARFSKAIKRFVLFTINQAIPIRWNVVPFAICAFWCTWRIVFLVFGFTTHVIFSFTFAIWTWYLI